VALGKRTRLQGRSDFGSPARAVPEAHHVHPAIGVIDPVDDAVGTDNNFANGRIAKLRHDPAQFRKVREALVLLMSKRPKLTARSGESGEM